MTAQLTWRGAHAERLQAAHNARTAAFVDSSIQERGRVLSGAKDLSAPNLESSTHLRQSPGYSVTVMNFGDGIVEARAVFVDGSRRLRSAKSSKENNQDVRVLSPEAMVASTEDKIAWARRRAARSLRYRCLALKADHMLTFTKRGKFSNVDELRAAWKRFYELLRRFPNLAFRYVAVPEMHGDGRTWHLHVAVRGRYDVVFLRALWYRALGGKGNERGDASPGSLNARYFHNPRKAALTVAGYMAKYMGKSFAQTGGGRKSYWASTGLVPETVQRFYEPAGDCALIRVRDIVAPMAPKQTLWRLFEWEYVGLHGFIFSTQ